MNKLMSLLILPPVTMGSRSRPRRKGTCPTAKSQPSLYGRPGTPAHRKLSPPDPAATPKSCHPEVGDGDLLTRGPASLAPAPAPAPP